MRDLHGKTAIICGGSAGVGRATLDALVAQGCRVGVIARGQERLDEIEAEFGHGADGRPRVATHAADVSDHAALESAVDALVARLGAAPEVWVNCAMLTTFSRFGEMTPEEFQRIVDVTFIGQVNGCRAALSHMARGTIVNVGSGLAYRAVPLQSAYCAAKHAINGFTASLRSELIREGHPVALSLVQLPAMDTPQFDWARSRLESQPQPAPPIYAPEIAADAIVRAAREAPRELLVGKSVLQLTAGQMAVPDWLDHKMAQAGVDSQHSGRAGSGAARGNLNAPARYPSRAHGSYTHRSTDDAVVVDGDQARWAGLAAVALAGIAIGLAAATPMRALTLGSRR